MSDVYDLAAPFVLHDPAEILSREVFARFGRAYYMGCCLERGVANALLLLEWRSGVQAPMTREQYEASYDKYANDRWASTFGTLVKRLLLQPDIPLEIQDNLKESVTVRNLIAHHFFWDHAGEFMIPSGQIAMINKCDEALALFERTDVALSDYVEPMRNKQIPNEIFQRECDKLIEAARARFQE